MRSSLARPPRLCAVAIGRKRNLRTANVRGRSKKQRWLLFAVHHVFLTRVNHSCWDPIVLIQSLLLYLYNGRWYVSQVVSPEPDHQ